MLDEDDEEYAPLDFHEDLGEHTLPESVRVAIVWASIKKFLMDTPDMAFIAVEEFTEKDMSLARAVVFHGPFEDFDKAMQESRYRKGVVVETKHTPSFWVACLSN